MATPTYNYETEASSIARRRKLLDALTADAMAPVQLQQTGSMLGEVTPMAGLAKVVQAALAARGNRKLDERESALGKRYNEDLAGGMRGYYDTSEGYMETPTGRQVPGNPRKALINLMSSSHPGLREFGGMMQKEQMAREAEAAKVKGQMELETHKHDLGNVPTWRDASAVATPQSIIESFQGKGPLRPRVNLEAAPSGQVMFNKDTGQVQFPANPSGQPAYALRQLNGGLYQETPTGYDPLDKGGVTVNTAPNPLLNSIGPEVFKAGMEVLKGKENAQRTIMMANKLEQLYDAGAFQGPLAGAATFMSALAEGMGMPLSDEVKAEMANSETAQSQIAGRMSEFLLDSSVGRTMTDADRKRIEEQFPQLTNSAEGRKYIIESLKRGADEKIAYAAQYMNDLSQNADPNAQLIRGWLELAPQNVNLESLQQPLTPATSGTITPPQGEILTLEQLQRIIRGEASR